MLKNSDLESKAINTLRFLSADAVQKANSGHPGLPMGTAAIAYTVWKKHLKYNPMNPGWFNRDRFILSGGHGSMLLYSLLHLTGYPLTLDDIKQFRQWGSLTPGHPEYPLTPGIETTTGPLGQGFANGVGMAIAEAHLAAKYNKPGFPVMDHYVYGIVTDGDLMEGVASEAASLAGHLGLTKLIYFYDDNRITIDGSTALTFTEDRGKRFEAYGWRVLYVKDGNDVAEIDQAVKKAKLADRPTLIICRTHIGYGLPTKQDTSEAHGSPPGAGELRQAKINLGWPEDESFTIPPDVLAHFREAVPAGKQAEENWKSIFNEYQQAYPELAAELRRRLSGDLPADFDTALQVFEPDAKGMATRSASGKVINQLAGRLPELFGGSADLTPSNNTWIDGETAFQKDNPAGRYLHFGVREHGMGAVINGMAYHGGMIPYGGTFLVFSDYMRPSVRLSAISHLRSIWVYTHDSIGLGEDGPTHQPVEHLAALRAIPNLNVIRPADANEVTEAWIAAIKSKNAPTALILSRQAVPVLDRKSLAPASGLHKGAYTLKDFGSGRPDVLLRATGSEVSLILSAAETLVRKGINSRVISFPSWELFEKQKPAYQQSVLLPEVKKRLAVETGVTMGWERWVGDQGKIIGINRYGASASAKTLMEKFGFTVDNIIDTVVEMMKGGQG
ncbi:MAG: transketolase [Chloroflexi bacterium]|nr:transketolase [Chloroflexota bacterium]